MFSQKVVSLVKSGHIYSFSIPANTGKFLPVSVSIFGVPNTGIPVSVYTGLETLIVPHSGISMSFVCFMFF
jgi:hypothetical protein